MIHYIWWIHHFESTKYYLQSGGIIMTKQWDSSLAASGDVSVFDGTPWTASEAGATLQLNLGEEELINRVNLNETSDGAVQAFHLEVLIGGNWENVYNNDYILKNRSCILPENETTSAVRLVVDELIGDAVINAFSADFQKCSNDKTFRNVSYASNQWYEEGWENFYSTPDQLNSLTDLIMINNFIFDEEGKFYIIAKKGEEITGRYAQDTDEANELMEQWITKLKSVCSNLAEGKTRLWFTVSADPHTSATTSTAFLQEDVRHTFAENVAAFARRHNIHGVVVDWEYPTTADSLQAFRILLAAMADVLHEKGLKLSSTLAPAYRNNLDKYQLEKLDYISYMTYTNTSNGSPNIQAQVPYERMEELIQELIDKGCPKEKIWIGLPFFGMPVPGAAVPYRALYTYYLKTNGVQTISKGLNKITYSNGKEYLYNGAYLLQDKVAYAAAMECGGVMSWWTGQDIPVFGNGQTAEVDDVTVQGTDSLTYAVYEAVVRFTGVNALDQES